MKNFKKNIALLSAIALAGTMLAGCGTKATTEETTTAAAGDTTTAAGDTTTAAADAAADTTAAAPAEDTGKVLKICGWNQEFQGLFN